MGKSWSRDLHAVVGFYEAMVSASLYVAVIGLGAMVLGRMFRVLGRGLGYRVSRLGAQALGASAVLLFAHFLALEFFGTAVPVWVLLAIEGVVLLLLLQGALNLLFGPDVGSRVIADLLTDLLRLVARIILRPFGALRDLFRR